MNKSEQKTPLCLLRDIYRAIREYEIEFQQKHDLCLNEGMALCSLKGEKMTSSDLANKLGLSASNMSKVLRSVEDKKLVDRMMGEEDKRQMYFILSDQGLKKLSQMAAEEEAMTCILDSIYQTQNDVIKSIL